MTLYDAFDWLEMSAPASVITNSIWLFPVVESGHLLGLAMLGGSVLVVDLRLLGFGLRDRSPAYVLAQSRPWLVGSITVMFATGIPLFISEAVKCYWSEAFWVKMATLLVALTYTFGVRNRQVASRSDLGPWLMRGLGLGSIMLWFTVAAAGRWIGFS